ncbi:MAG TPA: malonyl-ACP O-methyltransferase BioC [Steroidobacteraceae bacterium]|jgi:malonyl-CoA O-methyltransferase
MNEANNSDAARLDTRRVRAAFDRASGGYDHAAALQARVRTELIERLALFKLAPRVALDLGTGTGGGAQALRAAYRRALVLALDSAAGMLREARRRSTVFRRFDRILADAARLPLATASVDLVFSSLMLQWCDDLAAPLAEVRRVLAPGGLFVLSTFGPDTLHELREAWACVDGDSHVNRFLDLHDVGDALMRAGFAEPVLDVERVVLTYPNSTALMRDLKAIGAHNATRGRPRGLTGRAHMQKMQAAYEQFRRNELLPASFEVVYATAWGGTDRPTAAVIAGEARISVDAIRRRP